MVNGIASLIFLSDLLLLVYRNAYQYKIQRNEIVPNFLLNFIKNNVWMELSML